MTEIKATGKKDGRKTTVICRYDKELAEFTFNGREDVDQEAEILAQVGRTAIGGTYWPETVPLQIVAVLRVGFFDRPPEITVDGDLEEIPGEKGVVY